MTATFNNFLTTPQSESHYNFPIYDYEHWHKSEKLERIVKKNVNPIQKVVRTTGLLSERYLMLLVIDDVNKDGNAQNYKWTAQIARGLELDRYDVSLNDDNYKNDIILKKALDVGNRRLLVRVLENRNYDGSSDLEYIEILDYADVFTGAPYTPRPDWERNCLIVESTRISPNFKVLLFPYKEGDELPITMWNEERDVRFYKNEVNKAQIELVDSTLGIE